MTREERDYQKSDECKPESCRPLIAKRSKMMPIITSCNHAGCWIKVSKRIETPM